MKLLGISLGALLFAVMIWATLWFWGQSLTYKPYDHPLMSWTTENDQPAIALSTDHLQEAQDFLKKNPNGILAINLHVSSDGQLFTAESGDLDFISKIREANPDEYKGNRNYFYDFAFLKRNSSQLIPIEQWINLKPRFWIFNVADNALDIDKNLTQWIEKTKMQTQVVITSDADIVLSSMKDQNPLWIYGTSLSDLNKLWTMSSVNLETLVNFKRDYFITPVILKKRKVLNPQVIAEMRKRFKKVAIGPVHTDQDRAAALQMKPDVLILGSKIPNK